MKRKGCKNKINITLWNELRKHTNQYLGIQTKTHNNWKKIRNYTATIENNFTMIDLKTKGKLSVLG